MEQQRHGGDEAFDAIDADAVCEQCSTANPPGTLLCKMCGNNLRDQRARRLAEDVGMDAVSGGTKPRRILSLLLLAFGLLTIVWSVINVFNGNVERWLTEGLTKGNQPISFDGGQYWSDDAPGVFAELSEELAASPVTVEEASNRPLDMPVRETINGRYALRATDSSFGPILGGAIARAEGQDVFFVARLGGEDGFEIRGKASATDTVQEEGIRQYDAPAAGVQTENEILDAVGYGRLQPDGVVNCYGLLPGVNDTPYFFVAQPLP